ncbi:MAG: MATE family efflux transporter, partial [Spirochaetales bacterium]|nr:MATE family efflux transporter [Candidatus Physcosoma equi]
LTTLGNGVSNYTAQNKGAGHMDRIQEGFKAGLQLVWTLSLPVTVLYFFLCRPILLVFMDASAAEAVRTGIIYLRILSPFYSIIAIKLVADGILRGAGLMKEFMIDTFSDLILRVVFAVILSRTALGSLGIWCAWPIGWTSGTLLSIYLYRRGPWYKDKKVVLSD